MAFYITKNGQPTNIILTDGGSVEVGRNLSVDEQGRLNAEGGGGSNFDASRIKAGNYIVLTYLDLNEQEVQSPLDAYYVKIDANIPAMEETISQWERVVANALARHEQAIQELLNA